MKRMAAVLVTVCLMLVATFGIAEGNYISGDNMGVEGSGYGVVISKSATIRSKASYGGKSVISVPGGSMLLLSGEPVDGWRKVQYVEKKKAYEGWMREEYILWNPMILTLRKSNIPAYSAPSYNAKRVGSLSKYTELHVIGTWDNFYVVSLRDASAFIPMDAALWTSVQLNDWLAVSAAGYAVCETTLRTGPGEDWPEAATCKRNASMSISTIYEEDGWYFVLYDGKPAFARKEDVQFK